jgi:single-strand DNA-binding protein
MQQLTIVGHIGNDAEVKDLGTTQVINFTLAVQEKVKGEKVTTWYKCAYFVNNAAIAPYLLKGSLIGVTGKPEIEVYQGSDGTPRGNLKCFVREIKIYSSTKERASGTPQQAPTTQQPQNAAATPPAEEPDDLPF